MLDIQKEGSSPVRDGGAHRAEGAGFVREEDRLARVARDPEVLPDRPLVISPLRVLDAKDPLVGRYDL